MSITARELRIPVTFAVERGVPIPSGAKLRYPWESMAHSDSFMVPCIDAERLPRLRQNVRAAGTMYCQRRRPDHRIVSRVVEGGFRVWMVRRGEALP